MAERSHPKTIFIAGYSVNVDALRKGGVTCEVGYLGGRYRRDSNEHRTSIKAKRRLPNLAEQEIVICDMHIDVNDYSDYDGLELGWETSSRLVDPRPVVLAEVQDQSRRIYEYGGAFIVFAEPSYVFAYRRTSDNSERKLDAGASCRNSTTLSSSPIRAFEITCESDRYGRLMRRPLKEWEFSCSFKENTLEAGWQVVARNKYGQPVSLVRPPSTERHGLLLVVPKVGDKISFLADLIDRELPIDCPGLFVSDSPVRVTSPEYELPEVVRLEQQILQVQRQADDAIEALNVEIGKERERLAFFGTLC